MKPIVFIAATLALSAAPKPRARDLGVPFDGTPGALNAITDVRGVEVGQTTLMASDGCSETPGFAGFSLSLSVASQAEAERAFNALAEGGQVRMPLTKTFWSPCFGMLEDKFGIGWMISVAHQQGG